MAEFEAAQKMVDAANLYQQNLRALELRWMNILYELGLQGRGTLMLIPTNTPIAGPTTGLPPLGIVGVQELTGAQVAKSPGKTKENRKSESE